MALCAVIEVLCALVLLAAITTASERGRYIATFDRRTTGAALARKVAMRASDPAHTWNGYVMHAHEAVRAIVVSGDQDTCDVLLAISGVLHCEEDSVVHAL